MPTGVGLHLHCPCRRQFQSLFFWMMPTGGRYILWIFSLARVSILVLLDDAYRRPNEPCQRTRPLVSILVLLDDAYRLLAMLSSPSPKILFQSLFFWMMPTGALDDGARLPYRPVSILVLLDDAYRRRHIVSHLRLHMVSILVLLDDAYRPMAPGFRIGLKVCFNPCSSG